MKIYLKLPGREEIGFERKPMEPDKFRMLCRLAAFGLYVVLTKIIVSMNDFFALLWFFGLTLVLAIIWLLTIGLSENKGGSTR